MKEICIYEQEQILTIIENEVNEKNLLRIFLEHPKRTLYVMDKKDETVKGIITLGNFKRYLKDNTVLINEKFTALSDEEDVNNAKTIFEKKEKIMSIPMLGKDGKILREYCREAEEKVNTWEEILPVIEKTCKEAALAHYDKTIILLGGLFYDKTGLSEKIYSMTDGKVIVLDAAMYEKSFHITSQDKVKFYEINDSLSNAVRLLCMKYNIEYTWYIKDDIQRLDRVAGVLPLYKKAGILDVDKYYKDLFSDNESVCFLNASDMQYSEEKECYEYVGKEEGLEELEAIFGLYKLAPKSCIYINGRYVPMIISIGDYYGFDEDIAFNLIPQFNKKGIKTLVISSALDEYEEKKEEFKLDTKHRSPMDLSNCQNNFEEEQRKFWRYKGEYCQELRENFNLWQWVEGRQYPHWKDIKSTKINYYDGERFTCGNPESYERTMYLFGPCIVTSSYAADEETLGSFLRKKVDSEIYISNRGSLWANINYAMRNICYKSGDMIIIFGRDKKIYETNNIKTHTILDVFREIPNLQDNMWDLIYHCNGVAMEYIANKVYDICMSADLFSKEHLHSLEKTICSFGKEEKEVAVPKELEEWLEQVKKYKREGGDTVGSIVMNCNPFTRGHRYLIEEASKKVDILYIFILEEDKSFFKFEDRIKMVRLGVADLKNVVVIPSGKYMISSVTLPGYFEKETNPYGDCDAANDLGLFGGVIAKEFGIQIRFAGEEPIDIFTRQYNQSMKRILPEYGIEFREIPRKESGGEVISASRVRKYMKEGNIEGVKSLVLPVVYEYLEKYYM